jgi:methionyl-tRNA formyltransferase
LNPLKIAFLGTPEFSVPTLHALNSHPQVEILSVISMPDRRSGRGKQLATPPVAEYAKKHQLQLLQTKNINLEKDWIKDMGDKNLDAIIVLAFSQFLNNEILNLPKIASFNIHTSLLPKYRGAAPIQYAILNGDKVTGVSIQRMVKEMDAGDICFSREVEISDSMNSQDLFKKLEGEAAQSIPPFIEKLINENLLFKPQSEDDISFAPSINKKDGHLNFKSDSQVDILNKGRAFYPWPGTYCYLNNIRLKILEIEAENKKLQPGVLDTSMNTLTIGCADGQSIRLKEVQLEGKKSCHDFELINGFKNKFNSFEITREESNG